MPIKIGSTDINDIFIGANKVDNIFVGSNKVWSRPHLYSLTVGTRYISIPGITITGKDTVVGSLSLLNIYQWWSSSITNLTFENFDGVSPDGVVLQLSNGGVLNNDASFTTMCLIEQTQTHIQTQEQVVILAGDGTQIQILLAVLVV